MTKKIDWFGKSVYRKTFPLKKEKLSPELKAIHKMLDAVPWDILQNYWELRNDKEFIKERNATNKLKIKCAKEVISFIASSDFKDELKISPISGLPAIPPTGLTKPYDMTLSELRTISKEIHNVNN